MLDYKYKAYNLNFNTCIPIPQLPVSNADNPDVTVSWGKIAWQPENINTEHRSWHIDGDDAYFYWQFSGKYLVRGGTEIIIDPLPEIDNEHIIGLPILGPLMAIILQQRGYFLLHASGVKIDDCACLFLGCKGQGKSTMAATLYGRGHKLVADDIAAISLNPTGELTLLPGFPQIRLWPDSVVAALGYENPETLPEIYPNVSKRACPTFDNFHALSLPLKRIYILGAAEQPEIKPLATQDAIKHLIGNSYIPMTLGNIFNSSGYSVKHFQDCTKVIKQIDIYGLNRPRSLNLLSEVADLVEQDMTSKLCIQAAS